MFVKWLNELANILTEGVVRAVTGRLERESILEERAGEAGRSSLASLFIDDTPEWPSEE